MINQLRLPALVNGHRPATFGRCLHSSSASSARFTGALPDHTTGIMTNFASSSAPHFHSRRRDLSAANSGRGLSASISPEQLMAVAKQAAEAGAKIVMDVDKPRSITYKGATDLVTETDKASEEAILQVLRKAFPDRSAAI